MPLIIFLLITAGQFSCSWRQVCALGDNKDAQMSPLLFRRGATAGIFTLLELPSSIILRESPYTHDSVSPACNQTHSQKLSNASWGCCSLFSRLLDSKIVNHLTTFKLHSQTRVFSANIFFIRCTQLAQNVSKRNASIQEGHWTPIVYGFMSAR